MKRLMCALIVCLAVVSVAHAEPDERLTLEDVAFTAECDGSTQHYVLMLPKGFDPGKPHHLLIALHGHGSDRWQFSSGGAGTGKAARDAACERDMILVLPDYRAKTSWMGPKAEADVCQIIKEVKTRFEIDKTFISGGSMGGSSCLTFTALHPDLVAGVVSINGTANHLEYERFQDAISASFGGPKQKIPLEYKNRSAEYWPERFTMPVGITASGKDTIVPPHSVMRLANALEKIGGTVLLIYREEGGHSSQPEDIRKVFDFVLDEALKRDGE
jgi:dipeptidyl aminopeptidase/acylaminoacyl peptidase